MLIFNNVFTDQDACLMKFLLKFLVIYSFPKYSLPRPLLTIPGAYGYRCTLLVFFMSMFGWICYFIKCRKFDHHGSSLHLDRTFYRHHDRCPPDLVVTRPPQSEWPQLVFTLCQGTFTHKNSSYLEHFYPNSTIKSLLQILLPSIAIPTRLPIF